MHPPVPVRLVSALWASLLVVAVGCGSAGSTPTPGATPTASPGYTPPTATPTATPAPTPTPPRDEDDDGYAASIDCDEADPAINPGAIEDVGDGDDDDCDEKTDEAAVPFTTSHVVHGIDLTGAETDTSTFLAPLSLARDQVWAGEVTAIEAYVTPIGGGDPLPGSSVEYTGTNTVRVTLRHSSFDFPVTNPSTVELHTTLAAAQTTYTTTVLFSVGAVPDRVGFMFIDGVLYARYFGDVAFRPGSALFMDGTNSVYGPQEAMSDSVIRMAGPTTFPGPEALYLLYFSAGDRYATSFNEALLSTFEIVETTADRVWVLGVSSQYSPDLLFFTPADVDDSGTISWEDLEALDLSAQEL